jgi:molybdate transport system regulatory protein
MTPHARIRLDFANGVSVGPGKIALLEGIAASGSLSGAARVLGMSYRRAWLLAQDLNVGFPDPVMVFTTGGKHGGGASLTPLGESLIAGYRQLETEVDRMAGKLFSNLHDDERRPAAAGLRRRLPPRKHA